MRTQSYPSDITDTQWALIETHLPVYPGGRVSVRYRQRSQPCTSCTSSARGPKGTDRPDQDPAVDFMKLLLPELNRALFPDLSVRR
jgi:hypothetical protein